MSVTPVNSAYIVYPHQLFEELLALPARATVYMVEEPLFFSDPERIVAFHKKKLIMHRASMRALHDQLQDHGYTVVYMGYDHYKTSEAVFKSIAAAGIAKVHLFDPVDFLLQERITKYAKKYKLTLSYQKSPYFMTSTQELKDFFKGKKKYLMHSFYIFQRKRLGILLEHGKPKGGSWSFDQDNRKKIPKGLSIPAIPVFKKNKYVPEATAYIEKHFPDNPGSVNDFNYPITHQEAKIALKDFIKQRLALFGPYQDAIVKSDSGLFHSMLSAPINIGLLSPAYCVQECLAQEKHIPLASLEGFIRQIIGWREFMYAVYLLQGHKIRTANILEHTRRLGKSWYTGTTGIQPIDDTIKKVMHAAYANHIERLMVLGNGMLLSRIDPDAIYTWFMELFIDAYDWVMVPNVYAMSQFSAGDLVTTKPYFSGSNYILKMSDYNKAPWCATWDALFYAFLMDHTAIIAANPRLSILIKNVASKDPEKLEEMYATALRFFKHVEK